MMKTKLTLLGVAALITAACDHESGNAVSTIEPCSGDLLFTELPPEGLEGTPPPIRLSGVRVSPVPPTALSSPGTVGVIYVPRPEPIPAVEVPVDPDGSL